MRLRSAITIFTLLWSAIALAQPYRIDDFKIDIQLRKDATMSVTETIRVTFNESRRGIFRVLPIDLPSGRGTTRRVMITASEVSDDHGVAQPTKTTREGPNLHIRVGDEDVWLPAGTSKTYVFRYEAVGMLNWFEEAQDWDPNVELYWNLTGHDWDTNIDRVSFTISYPDPGTRRVRARLFSGIYGSREHIDLERGQGRVEEGGLRLAFDGGLSGGSSNPLMPGEGLTVVLSLPIDAIQPLSFAQEAKLFLLPNAGFLIPVIVLLLMIPLYLMHGHDPKGGPMVVRFDPPENLSGPEVGTMIDERVDQRDLAAGIVSLAVKGYLNIYPYEEGTLFKRRSADLEVTEKQPGPDLTPFEHKLLRYIDSADALGGRITPTELRTTVAPMIGELRESLYEGLVDHGYYVGNPNQVRIAWTIGGIIFVALLGALFFWISPTMEVLPSIVGGVMGALFVLWIARMMPKRTAKGARAHAEVQGFEEFIKRARSNELNWMSKKHPDQSLFEQFLPHAIAFGLTREWAEAFRNIELVPPSWYRGEYYGHWNPIWLASDLTSVTQSVATAASTPPRSEGASGGWSGFGGGGGGGGFSGGGFGGGGGGSW